MQEYDDFALPNIENIEQMAKAYQKFNQNRHNSLTNNEDVNNLYKNVNNFCNVIDFVCRENLKKVEYRDVFDLSKKLKLYADSFALEYNITTNVPLQKIKSQGVLYNMMLFCNKIFSLALNNLSNKHFVFVAKSVNNIIEKLLKAE